MLNSKENSDNPEEIYELEEWINRKTGVLSSN
jgi:hypothetical protein